MPVDQSIGVIVEQAAIASHCERDTAPHGPKHTVGYCDGRPDINPSADRSLGA
jgi:hypothetical protein